MMRGKDGITGTHRQGSDSGQFDETARSRRDATSAWLHGRVRSRMDVQSPDRPQEEEVDPRRWAK